MNAEPPTNINRMIKRRILSEKDGEQPTSTVENKNKERKNNTRPDNRKKKYISILTNKPVSNLS